MMADTSPEWKKPVDVMKLRRRKSLCTDLCAALKTASQPSSRRSVEACPPRRKAQKRSNPFAYRLSSVSHRDNEKDAEVDEKDGVTEADLKHFEAVPASNCLIDVLVSSFNVDCVLYVM